MAGFPELTGSLASKVDFERQIRPILTRNCLVCHGPDVASRKAGLRIDLRSGIFGSSSEGAPIVRPGDPSKSLLFQRITDPSDPMPPSDHPRLTPYEVELLRLWIEEGANFQEHWAWSTLQTPEIPSVKKADWCLQESDRFILARLEQEELMPPAPEAHPLVWLRRVIFDLTGLPPTAEQIDTFIQDSSPTAREQLVDELLESQQYAEHFARHWLDLMRYAESHGHEYDYDVGPAHEYRDWVIEAIAEDLPLDRFVQEQIAGDLLADQASAEGSGKSHRATGWWWLSQATHAPVDVLGDTLDRVDNQIDVLSRAFLGATVSCARCHDHKFDTISQSDWTALSGIIRSTRRVLHPVDETGQVSSFLRDLEPIRNLFQQGVLQSLKFQSSLPLGDLLRAARDLHLGQTDEVSVASREEMTLGDFSEGWQGWNIEGDAFGEVPHRREDLPEGFEEGLVGDFLATSHDRRPGSDSETSDHRVGQLESRPFRIDRDYLCFLVGGGDYSGETCVQLWVDGQSVSEAVGENSTRLRKVRWDVSEYAGRQAVLKIIDRHQGNWGHISATSFVLTDEPPQGFPSRSSLLKVSRDRSLDKDTLRDWVKSWTALMSPTARRTELKSTDRLIDDFKTDAEFLWALDGPAFEQVPAGTWLLIGEPRVTVSDVLTSAAHSRALAGTALSRSFVADQDFLHVITRGEESEIRVIVEGYWLDQHNPLLFEGFIQKVENSSEDQHLIFDLSRYQNRHVHVEIQDRGNGWVSVDRLWLSDDRSLPEQSPDWTATLEEREGNGKMLSDPLLLDRLLKNDLVQPSRWGGAWNAAVIKPVMEWKELESRLPEPRWALACSDAPVGRDVPLQIRGDSTTPGELIPRSSLEFLSARSVLGESIQGSGRSKLADWMTSAENPLFWRAQANRIWRWVMGEGLVDTPDDLGRMGSAPENQNLLDYLANRLSKNPSRRDLIRELVLSQTYAMDSQQPEKRNEERDPLNRFWHRSHQKVLKAEAIRDGILMVSGRLDRQQGGVAVPIHLTDFLAGRGRPGTSGPVDGEGRRTIYLSVRRNFLDPFLTVFDFPIPATTVGKRDRSNVPAQALALMNSAFVQEQAQFWGARLHEASKTEGVDPSLILAWKAALGRPPSEQELAAVRLFVVEGQQQDWVDLAHVLFQSKEFRFVR